MPHALKQPAVAARSESHAHHAESAAIELPPGIVIHDGFEPPTRTSISAFIWGGKTRPLPALPYGRRPT
jgi:hypothetical protein